MRISVVLFAISFVKPEEYLGAYVLIMTVLVMELGASPVAERLDGNLMAIVALVSRIVQTLRAALPPVAVFGQLLIEVLWCTLSLCMMSWSRGIAKEVWFGVGASVMLGGGLSFTYSHSEDHGMFVIRCVYFMLLCIFLHALDSEVGNGWHDVRTSRLRFLGCCTPVLLVRDPVLGVFTALGLIVLMLRLTVFQRKHAPPANAEPDLEDVENGVESGVI